MKLILKKEIYDINGIFLVDNKKIIEYKKVDNEYVTYSYNCINKSYIEDFTFFNNCLYFFTSNNQIIYTSLFSRKGYSLLNDEYRLSNVRRFIKLINDHCK